MVRRATAKKGSGSQIAMLQADGPLDKPRPGACPPLTSRRGIDGLFRHSLLSNTGHMVAARAPGSERTRLSTTILLPLRLLPFTPSPLASQIRNWPSFTKLQCCT